MKNQHGRRIVRAQERPTISCLLLTNIRIYEAVTGIRSKSATIRIGSSAPDNRVLAMYRKSITVIGTISEK
jgi:hypothetical protein